MVLLLDLLEQDLQLIPFGSGLQNMELLPLELVFELGHVRKAVDLVDDVHQVEDLVHVLLSVLPEGRQSRLVLQIDGVLFVFLRVIEQVL